MKLFIIILFGIFCLAGCDSQYTINQMSSQSTISSLNLEENNSEGSLNQKIMSLSEVSESILESYPNSKITSLDLDTQMGHYRYLISIVQNQYIYELELDAETQELQQLEKNISRDDDQFREIDLSVLLDLEKINPIAEIGVPGSQLIQWHLDNDSEQIYWEITLKEGLFKTSSIKIDAQTGDIIAIESD